MRTEGYHGRFEYSGEHCKRKSRMNLKQMPWYCRDAIAYVYMGNSPSRNREGCQSVEKSRFNNGAHQDMAQIDEDLNRQEIRRRRDEERKKREVEGKWSRKTKYRWLDADWMAMGYAGHAVAMEKRLAAEWMAVIFFLGTYFRGCGGGDAERSVFACRNSLILRY
jgi:hypothetical protein